MGPGTGQLEALVLTRYERQPGVQMSRDAGRKIINRSWRLIRNDVRKKSKMTPILVRASGWQVVAFLEAGNVSERTSGGDAEASLGPTECKEDRHPRCA